MQVSIPVTTETETPADVCQMKKHIFALPLALTVYENAYKNIFLPHYLHSNPVISSENWEIVLSYLNCSDYALLIESTHRKLCCLFAALAIGANLCGQSQHAELFITKARISAKQLFDQYHYETACGFNDLAYYAAFVSNDKSKASRYYMLTKKMCDALSNDLRSVNLKITALWIQWSCERNATLEICEQLNQLPSPIARIFAIFFTLDFLLRIDDKEQIQNFMSEINKMDELTAQVKLTKLKCLELSGLYKGLLSALCYPLGKLDIAIILANESTNILNTQIALQENNVLPFQAVSIEWTITVYYLTANSSMLDTNIKLLRRFKEKFPVLEELEQLLKYIVNEFSTEYSPTASASASSSYFINLATSPSNSSCSDLESPLSSDCIFSTENILQSDYNNFKDNVFLSSNEMFFTKHISEDNITLNQWLQFD